MRTSSKVRALGATCALVLAAGLVTACGDDASPDPTDAGGLGPAAGAPTTPVEGCKDAVTDPDDLALDRAPARCEPGAPEAVPLEEQVSVKIGITSVNSTFAAPVVWADKSGEFDAENLDVELVIVSGADAINLLAQGDVDVVWGGPNALFANAVAGGFDQLRWILGSFSSGPDTRNGLWYGPCGLDSDDPSTLSGETIATAVGSGSPVMYPLGDYLGEAGVGLDDVELTTLAQEDIVTALENCSVPAAWILDPFWQAIDGEDGFEFAVTQPPGEPLGGALAGPRLTTEEPATGVALVRAIIRTMNTRLAGDLSDPAFVDELATVLEVEPEDLAAVPPVVWDWEIRSGTTDRIQEAWLETDAADYDEPLPESALVDRSLYLEAVGADG